GMDLSLRTITSKAGVNLAAVNYHFQSKETLIDAMIERRIGPINNKRFELLDALEREFPEGPLPLERILRAFLAPVLQMKEHDDIRIVFGRVYALPDEVVGKVLARHLRPVLERFDRALARVLPPLAPSERIACVIFTAGAMVHLMAWSRMIGTVTNGLVDIS